MLMLGVDTSGKQGSIALVRCEAPGSRPLEIVALQGGTFSAQLVPQIAGLLEKHGFRKHDIEGFAVVSGPGSFTGLRVGLAAIKGLAEVLNKPIAAVSLLEALAMKTEATGQVLSTLDAGRGEMYAGLYERTASGALCLHEELLNLSELGEKAGQAVIVTSDPGVAEGLRAKSVAFEEVERPRSDMIACMGWRKIQAGQTTSPEDLEANYIRRSDAEIFAKSR